MSRFVDLSGQRFGNLVALYPNGKTKAHKQIWRCQCDCGNQVDVIGCNLTNHHSNSCGCYARKRASEANRKYLTSNETKSKLYSIWHNMLYRCNTPTAEGYSNYGGRGIKVCDEWTNDYQVFKNWSIENGYNESSVRGNCTLDRIDTNGNYEPSNCRWVNMKVQSNNRRSNHFITYNGKTQTISQWAKELGISVAVIYTRINRQKWNEEIALTTPVRKYKN